MTRRGESPPTIIKLGRGIQRRREESFADGRLVVLSAKGVHAAEAALLHALPHGRTGSALVINSTEALAAIALRILCPDLAVHAHFDDAWDLGLAQQTAARHPELAPSLALAPDPPDGPWDIIALPSTKAGVADLLRERLAFAVEHLKPGGLLFTSTDNPRDRFLRDEVVKLFGAATTVPSPSRRRGVAYVARRLKTVRVRKRPRERAFTVREGEAELRLVSRPGIFCHGRLDDGTRALLAAADVAGATRILDLGCGTGVIGLAAALRCPEASVTLVDSFARAVECTRCNIEAAGLEARCEVLLTADPAADLAPGYDLVLTNPPYYGNYRISEAFLTAARALLVPGGRLILVTKGIEWHEARMGELFGGVATRQRGGYWLLEARLPAPADPR